MGISPVAQGYQFSDIAVRHIRASLKIPSYILTVRAVGGCDAVSLFRDGEAGHLKGAACENILQAVPVSLILTVHGQRLRKAADYCFLNGPVGFQGYKQA